MALCSAAITLERGVRTQEEHIIETQAGSVEGDMARTFTTQVYLNKSEHIRRLGGPRGQGRGAGGREVDAQKGLRESVWYELGCGGSGWGPRGSAGLWGWGRGQGG